MMFTALIAFAAYVAGCYSHKWAAKAYYDGTGRDAQADADKAKATIASVSKTKG